MSPRQNILDTISHKEPDRVPVDLGSNPSSGISAIAYNNLKKYLGIEKGHTRIYDVVQQLARPEECILDHFNIAVVDIGSVFTDDDDWYDTVLADSSTAQYPVWFKPDKNADGSFDVRQNNQSIARMPAGGTFFDQTYFPYLDHYPGNFDRLPEAMQMVLWQALAHSPWDHVYEPGFWGKLRERTLQLRARTNRALMITCGGNLFEWGCFLRRMDNFLMDLLTEPANVEALLEALMDIHLETLDNVCRAVGDIVDILRFGDDLGSIQGPLMSPDVYRHLLKKHHTVLNRFVHQNSQMKTFLHSCGSIFELMPDLITAGYDIINPVQTNAAGMDPATLKKEFGKDIVFWGGGIDSVGILNQATPEKVREKVLERLDIFSRGGGYVFNTVHNILPEVPPENIVAMFEAVREYNGR